MSRLFDISGKVALVTGGSRGIGLMIARGFVEAGAKTYISSRKAGVCDAVAAELSQSGECISIPADLGSEAGCRYLAEEFAKREPKLHILVNNAGATWGAPIAEFPDDAFDKVMNLNVKGIFHLTRFLLPQLEAAATQEDPARVINIGSVDGDGNLRLLVQQGGGPPAHAAPGAQPFEPEHRRQRDRARAVREQDDARDHRAFRCRHDRDEPPPPSR
jgi:NAD(P)-dependent dehydrogenase (short-subunit alcohol dehydrogenase family)